MIRLTLDYFRDLTRWLIDGWNRFWFAPADPATLCAIRVLAGAMLLYTHLVWTAALEDFFLPTGWINPQAAKELQLDGFAWSYFWWIESPALLWTVHIIALAAFAMLTVGLFTRTAAIVSVVAATSYANRAIWAQFGLDQINIMLALYLAVGPSGDCYSLDRWLQKRRDPASKVVPSISANLAIRLMQVHMCVIYFFAGLGKLQGESWWRGQALWGAVANLEYQSLDLTWLAAWPLLIAILTSITAYWELSFCVLVWVPKLRPLVLAVAVPLHLGIAFGMGMITFGLVMLFGCASFISPSLVRRLLDRPSIDSTGRGQERGGEGTERRTAATSQSASRRRPPVARATKLA